MIFFLKKTLSFNGKLSWLLVFHSWSLKKSWLFFLFIFMRLAFPGRAWKKSPSLFTALSGLSRRTSFLEVRKLQSLLTLSSMELVIYSQSLCPNCPQNWRMMPDGVESSNDGINSSKSYIIMTKCQWVLPRKHLCK